MVVVNNKKTKKTANITKPIISSINRVPNLNTLITQLNSPITQYLISRIKTTEKLISAKINNKTKQLTSSLNSKLNSLYNRLLCSRCHSPTNVLSCNTKLCINPKCLQVGISIIAPTSPFEEDVKQ